MDRVRVSSKGQVVIPRQLRRALKIRAGTEVTMERRDDESFTVRLAPSMTLREQWTALAGILARPGQRKGKPSSTQARRAAIIKLVRQRYERVKRGK